MSYVNFRLNKPTLTDVEVSKALELNRMPTYGGLFHGQFMIATMDKGIVSIKEEFLPEHLPALLRIAQRLK